MKKILCTIIASVMLFCTVSMLAGAKLAEDQATYVVDTTKTDVLDGELAFYDSPKNGEYAVVDDGQRATDGNIGNIANDRSYLNKAWCDKDAQHELAAAPGTIEYQLKDGTKANYLYSVYFEDLNVDVDSFAIYQQDGNGHTGSNFAETDPYPWWRQDAQFQILVSQDGGQTYEIAWSSVEFKRDAEGKIISCASWDIEEGGHWTKHEVKDAEGKSVFQYRVLEENFKQKYDGVTNIVYGCLQPRIDNDTNFTTFFYYVARLSEFDVYGVKHEVATTEEATTEEPKTEAPVATTEEPKTDAPVASTEAPKGTDSPANTEAPTTDDKKGCGSSAAVIGVAMVMTLGCAAVRKKH